MPGGQQVVGPVRDHVDDRHLGAERGQQRPACPQLEIGERVEPAAEQRDGGEADHEGGGEEHIPAIGPGLFRSRARPNLSSKCPERGVC